jgi:predicted DNA-binding transcriptional regulator AlpA
VPDQELLTVTEALAELRRAGVGLSRASLYRLIEDDEVPVYLSELGKAKIRISRKDLAKLIARLEPKKRST